MVVVRSHIHQNIYKDFLYEMNSEIGILVADLVELDAKEVNKFVHEVKTSEGIELFFEFNFSFSGL